MSLLEIHDLRTSFYTPDGTVRAVNDVSLSLEQGEIVGLVGESGSGKSTIATVLAERWGLRRLSSDEARKRMVGLGRDQHAPPPRPRINEDAEEQREEQVRRQAGGAEQAHLRRRRVERQHGEEREREQCDLVAEDRDRLAAPQPHEVAVPPEPTRPPDRLRDRAHLTPCRRDLLRELAHRAIRFDVRRDRRLPGAARDRDVSAQRLYP